MRVPALRHTAAVPGDFTELISLDENHLTKVVRQHACSGQPSDAATHYNGAIAGSENWLFDRSLVIHRRACI